MQIRTPGKLFILFGPSAAGKTSLLIELLKNLPPGIIAPVITYTSRAPRSNEVNGKDYHFITPEDFLEKLNVGFFIHDTHYIDNRYGCSKTLLQELKEGKNFIAVFDRAGAQEAKKMISDSVLIWITAPLDELKRRLCMRYVNNPEQYRIRLERLQQDLATESTEKIHDYAIMNDNFKHALHTLEAIINKELAL